MHEYLNKELADRAKADVVANNDDDGSARSAPHSFLLSGRRTRISRLSSMSDRLFSHVQSSLEEL